eukprot:1191251-Prorocentrum_minimum.AAC.3
MSSSTLPRSKRETRAPGGFSNDALWLVGAARCQLKTVLLHRGTFSGSSLNRGFSSVSPVSRSSTAR